MDYLYVCHFSNGHIKVGRSIDPSGRVASHADRVACLGVELVEHAVFLCAGLSVPSEAQLIRQCRDVATASHKNEWFAGLDFTDVCAWAKAAADGVIEPGKTHWSQVIADLQRKGVTQQQLATLCGCRQGSISDLATGRTKDPSYSIGKTLVDVHAQMLPSHAINVTEA